MYTREQYTINDLVNSAVISVVNSVVNKATAGLKSCVHRKVVRNKWRGEQCYVRLKVLRSSR